MAPPALIEIAHPEGHRICLVFQSKKKPLLQQEICGGDPSQACVNVCPDDSTLFLEGSPSDYVNRNIILDPPDCELAFTFTEELLEAMQCPTTCAFGDVGEGAGDSGGIGPGFVFDGLDIEHDVGLGVANDTGIVGEAQSQKCGIVVLVDRPDEYAIRKYYDEDEENACGGDSGLSCESEEQVDVDMEGDEPSPEADALTASMKTLRLKGK